MPIKYIGRTHTFAGKPLWEIVGNLKNYGVGRIVTRSIYKKFPEPTYWKILKVAGLPDVSKHPHDPRRVAVLTEYTFRGKKYDKLLQMDLITYKPDFILIPKDEEEAFMNGPVLNTCKIMAPTTDLPPLLKEILRRQAWQQNNQNPDLKLEVVFNLEGTKNYRVAKEGETPTDHVIMGLGKPVSPSLYENIKQQNVSEL